MTTEKVIHRVKIDYEESCGQVGRRELSNYAERLLESQRKLGQSGLP